MGIIQGHLTNLHKTIKLFIKSLQKINKQESKFKSYLMTKINKAKLTTKWLT